ncbi:MAG: hypothetical protein JO290_10715 [Sphingomonadaceae bacterium]|nr:hypothetical protein [Sphingomonadaceae bacterium]
MNKVIALALAAGVALGATTAADARDGCGRGFFRGPYGHCRPIGGPGYGAAVVAPGLVIGNFYRGRGYWDGHRYWWHRDRDDRGGWRYR